MSGGSTTPTPQVQQQGLQIPTNIQQQLTDQFAKFSNQTERFGQRAGDVSGQLQTQFGQGPQLELAKGPQFGAGLDPMAQSQIAQGQQQLAQQAAGQRAQIAQQFRGQPGVSNILQSQAARQTALQQNPLLAQAREQQRGRQEREFQLGLQAQEAANKARLGMGQADLQRQLLGNQALMQQLGLEQAPMAAQQQLLSGLSGLAQLLGVRTGVGFESPNAQPTGMFKQSPFFF